MDYGNNLGTVFKATVVGAIIGLIAVLAAVIGITAEASWQRARPLYLFLIFLPAPAILALIVGITACFCIRITGDRVQHLFLKRIVLSDLPVSEFVGLDHIPVLGQSRPKPVLRFRNGRTIRLLGASWQELERLERDLGDVRMNQEYGSGSAG
jgi:hypothetical protein